jgi:O-antigen/teichoic acid export membrane protein
VQDKIVLASSLALLLLFGSWPVYQQVKPVWIGFLSLVVGGIVSTMVLLVFGSAEMKTKLLKRVPTKESIEAKGSILD